jgi:DNA-binding PadR family transcriptional regulator
MTHQGLGEFEQLVLLAIVHLGEEAYGIPIVDEIERRTGRRVARAAVYVTLRGLEEKGLLTSWMGDPTPERGGKARRYVQIEAAGRRALRDARQLADLMWGENARVLNTGLGASGALVLVLSSIGLYGSVALAVRQRRREIGVRMALGARADQVVALFYTGGVRLGLIGLVLGLPLSVAASNVVAKQDGAMSHVIVGAVIALVVLVVASIATLIPAMRAARVNPVISLRSE